MCGERQMMMMAKQLSVKRRAKGEVKIEIPIGALTKH
jgi:hypothetical protein